MIASSTNARSSIRGPSCNSQRKTSVLAAIRAKVIAGNRRDGMLSRIGSTAGSLTVILVGLKRNRLATEGASHRSVGLRSGGFDLNGSRCLCRIENWRSFLTLADSNVRPRQPQAACFKNLDHSPPPALFRGLAIKTGD